LPAEELFASTAGLCYRDKREVACCLSVRQAGRPAVS